MTTLVTRSSQSTKDLGTSLAEFVQAGDVLLVSGDLGSGKTTFVQGLGQGLGVTDPITSPTFVLIRSYQGRELLVHHVDVYRLDNLQEVTDLALREMVDDDATAVIEWGELAAPALPADYLLVRIEFGDSDDQRRFEFRVVGPSWSSRLPALRKLLQSWDAGADKADA